MRDLDAARKAMHRPRPDPEEAELEAAPAENSQGLKVTAPGLAPARAPVLEYSAPSEEVDGSVTKVAAVNPDGGEGALEYAGTPKNAPCPCGSGRKYKRCHGADS